jgi:NAD(P)-dependent dehydrogenase (short-subunit alcohol dehydrogenase family)
MDVRGKVAIVTGAALGIGRTTATQLAATGAAAVIADVDGIARCGWRMRSGSALPVPADVASTARLGSGQHDAPEYATAKAGVIRLSSALAALAEEANIRVNCLCPGSVDTPAMRRSLGRVSKRSLRLSPVVLRPKRSPRPSSGSSET